MVAIRLVFWSLPLSKKFLNSLCMFTQRSLKHPYFIRAWVPVTFFLSLCLSISFPQANSLARGDLASSLSRPGFQDLFETMPCALMSGTSPVSSALLVLSVNQGISASFSLWLSYHGLWTTRFWSIKGHNIRLQIREGMYEVKFTYNTFLKYQLFIFFFSFCFVFLKNFWGREWLPILVFLLGNFLDRGMAS